MIEESVTKACASCGKPVKPKAAQHKKCLLQPAAEVDKKATKLSSALAAQETFKQRR